VRISRFYSILTVLLGIILVVACNNSEVPTGKSIPQPEAGKGDPAVGEFELFEVTYFTPAQQEGPYYPVDKPADLDNDLVDFAGAKKTPAGEVLSLAGVIYDANGRRVEGAVIEIWQTDNNGIYMHPGDPNTGRRDPNFQFYGEALTGADGVYIFRTILPGIYEPRPRHIHSKIKLDGKELLTTQFYFSGEVAFTGTEANLIIELAPAEDDMGNPIWIGERDIILDIVQ